jgi:hypothetical membrane protein
MDHDVTNSKALLLFGIIGPVFTLLLIWINIFLFPGGFSWYKNALSDLGVHTYSYLFNYAVTAGGIMILVFSYGLYRRRFSNIPTTVMFIIGAIGLSMVGLFNEDAYPTMHFISALLYFFLFPIGIIYYSLTFALKHLSLIPVGLSMAAISLVAIIAGIIQVETKFIVTGFGLGLFEMIEAVALSVWIIVVAAYFLSPERQ